MLGLSPVQAGLAGAAPMSLLAGALGLSGAVVALAGLRRRPTLPDSPRPDVGQTAARPETAHTGAVHTGAVQTGAVQTGAVHRGAVRYGATDTEAVQSEASAPI